MRHAWSASYGFTGYSMLIHGGPTAPEQGTGRHRDVQGGRERPNEESRHCLEGKK